MHPTDARLYLGIDPSLRSTGLVIIGENKPLIRRITPTKLRGTRRLQYHRDALREIIPGCVSVCIEGPSYNSLNRAHDIGRLHGVLLLELEDHQIPTLEIPPNTLKLFATGRGDASKELVKASANERWNLKLTSDDETDALWLSYLAQRLDTPDFTGLKRYQLEVIHGIRNMNEPKNKPSNHQQFNV